MLDKPIAKVFISYKRQEQAFVIRLKEALESCGYEVWVDVERIISDDFILKISEGLDTSSVIVGIITPEAVKSEWVLREWGYALVKNKPIVLVMYKKTTTDEMPFPYATFQFIDFTKEEAQEFTRICQAINSNNRIEYKSIPKSAKLEKTTLQITNRDAMLTMVRSFWIDGVLRRANPLKEKIDTLIQLRSDALVRDMRGNILEIPSIKSIYELYKNSQKKLLILGAPGSGKTYTMLQLTDVLIEDARLLGEPIPIILNLSSWAERQQSLDAWIVSEMKNFYHVPSNIAWKWLEEAEISLMLDGLDEVSEKYRNDCVEAINRFSTGAYKPISLVICSRVKDYEILKSKLDLEAAVEIQPLSQTQIDLYLSQNKLETLQTLINNDQILKDFSQSPFLLTTMGYAYQGKAEAELVGFKTAETRRSHLFETYINKRIRDESHKTYSLIKTRAYLAWLAGKMQEQSWSVFLIEKMQPSPILPPVWYQIWQWLARSILILVISLLAAFSLTTIYTSIPLPIIVIASITIATIMWSACEDSLPVLARIIPDSVMAGILGYTILEFASELSFGIVLVGALAAWAIGFFFPYLAIKVDVGGHAERNRKMGRPFEISTPEILKWNWLLAAKGVLMGIVSTIFIAAILTLLFDFQLNLVWVASVMIPLAITGGLSSEYVEIGVSSRPNQGLFQTGHRAGQMFLIVFSSAFILAFLSGLTLNLALPHLITFSLFQALLTGGTSFFVWGGYSTIKHILLRLILTYILHETPINYAEFLDYSTYQTMLLRRVGGGYIFLHRYLLEHFAELYKQNAK